MSSRNLSRDQLQKYIDRRPLFGFERRLSAGTIRGADMGKLGKTYPGAGGRIHKNSAAALGRFDRPFTEQEERMIREQLIIGVIGLLGVMGFVGWLFTL
jgi:hypothetical protein